MKIGAIYVRKSIQTEKGDSIRNQIDICKDYAMKRNILIDDCLIYCDEGYSGKDFNRPEFKKMIGDLKQNKFNVLICYRLDRISRSLNDFSNLNKVLEEYSISFISVKELFDTSTPIGKSMMYIASVFSQLERETITERLRDNISKLSRTGRWLGGVTPTGFKSILTTYLDADLNKRKMHKLTPITSELYMIELLFNKFIDLRNLTDLETYCNNENLKSKNDLQFSTTTLRQILVNPVYCIGDEILYDYLNSNSFYISNRRDEFNGKNGVVLYTINEEKIISLSKHAGVIKSAKWIEAQNILSDNKKRSYRQGTSSVGLLSGLMKCSHCGSLMRVKHGRKNIHGVSYYYVCTLKEKDKNKCDTSNLNGIDIDMLVCQKIQFSYIKKSFLHFLLEYLHLDRIDLKNTKQYSILKKSNDDYSELGFLCDNLSMLKHQLEINKDSPSYKYIFDEMSILQEKIELMSKFKSTPNNTNKTPKPTVLERLFYELMLLNFDICSLSFINKKHILNKIFDYMVWDNIKLKSYIR